MAAISRVFTIACVARRLGEDEETLAELVRSLKAEDGCLWVMNDLDTEDATRAFTECDIENLTELLAERKR